MKSIQGRLAFSLAASLIALFIFQWIIVSYSIRHVSDEIIHNRLQQDADSLIAALIVLNSGKISLPFASLPEVYNQPFSGHYYRIDGPVNSLRSRSLWDEDLPQFNLKPGEQRFMSTLGPLSQKMFVNSQIIRKGNRLITISIAQNVTDLENDLHELQVLYAFIAMLALLTLIVLQTLLIRKGFKPVQRAEQQIKAMQRGEIFQLDNKVPNELVPIVNEINRLVSLLAQRIQRSRNSLGNLAHALKAPLTVMTQISNEKEQKGDDELSFQLRHQTVYMRELIERELKRARLACVSGPGRHLKIPEDINSLIDMIEKVYQDKDLAMDINLPDPVSIAIDREDIMELLGNLFDNACKFAHQIVKLTVIIDKNLILVVEDDGPGVASEKIAELSKRGTRVDESKIGHGLGMAIVSDTVKHYQGSIKMDRSSALGGFRVIVQIPLADG